MEWNFCTINDILPTTITCIDNNLVPGGFHGDVSKLRLTQKILSDVINTLGEESTKAQGLKRVLTTSDKLRNSSQTVLYLLKDENGANGIGEVIGLLKVARKRLYLFDANNKSWEGEPWCVLDFFIKPERQKQGYGKIIYDHMLQDLVISPHQLAIDGPSDKMIKFMAKNYGVDKLVRQNNNFAVSDKFFEAVPEDRNKSGPSTPRRVPSPVFGRYAAHQPQCSVGNIIHGAVGGTSPGATNGFHKSRRETPRFY